MSELKHLITVNEPKIIGISETWLYGDINDGEISQTNFQIYRSDRQQGKGGGVVIYVHNSLVSSPYQELTDIQWIHSESVWCTVQLNHTSI